MSGLQYDFEITGTLLADAEARTRQSPDGGTVPVLCLSIETESSSRGRAIVEEPFPAQAHAACRARAAELRRGARVTVRASHACIQLMVRNATHVHLHQDASTASASLFSDDFSTTP